MRGINLKDSIKTFGFKYGFSFWFRWNILDPLKIFYWKYIIVKPLCTEHGYFMCNSNCKCKKITGRKNIIKYEKIRREKIDIESKTIRGYDTGVCFYCGENEGTEIIDDPNWNTLERWLVCKTCKEVIELQREMTFPLTSIDRQQEISDRLLEISKQTGQPIMIMTIDKNQNTSSVVYGDK
jgi:hypothetical protein